MDSPQKELTPLQIVQESLRKQKAAQLSLLAEKRQAKKDLRAAARKVGQPGVAVCHRCHKWFPTTETRNYHRHVHTRAQIAAEEIAAGWAP